MPDMPGTNLTRDEAQTRAALLDVESYDIDLDLTGADTTFASTTVLRFSCSEPGAEHLRRPRRRDRPRDHAQRRGARPVDVVRRHPDRARRPGGRQRAAGRRADCPTATPARACTASSTRSTTGSTSTRQFEVPDARRVFTTFEQPDLKAVFTFNVTAPVRLEGRLQRADTRAGARSATARPCGTSRRPSRCRPTSPRSSPVSTTRSRTSTRASTATIPLGHYCRQSLVEHLDPDEIVKITKQGFEFFEEAFDFPYPFGSTTSSTCRSTTWARWRTPAA